MDTANQYVKLNVGGALFHTTLGTLLKYDSMFKAMFSGRNEVFLNYFLRIIFKKRFFVILMAMYLLIVVENILD